MFGAIASAVGSAVGGILGANSQKDANAANMAFNREQFEYQKELHRNQLQWKVEDAKKAGLHPMAALGLSSMSFSPVSSNMQGNDYSWMGDMGQALGAGYAAMKAKDKNQQKQALALAEKQAALSLHNMELQNQSLELENEYQRFKLQQAVVGGTSQALRSSGSASVSGLPASKYAIDGQADSRLPDKDGPVVSAGGLYNFMETSRPGVFELVPSGDWSQTYEDKPLGIDLWPIARTYARDLFGRFSGDTINGMVYSDTAGGWVKAGSKLDDAHKSRRSLPYWYDKFGRAYKRLGRDTVDKVDKYFHYK